MNEMERKKYLKVLAAKEKLKVTHPGLTYTKRAVCRVDKEMDPEKARELSDLLDRQQSILCPKPLLEEVPEAVSPMGYAPGVWRHTTELSPEDLKENKDWDDKRDDEEDTERDIIKSLLQCEQNFKGFDNMSEKEQITQIAYRFQRPIGQGGELHPFLNRKDFFLEELQWALEKISHAYLVKVGANVKDGE